MTSLETRLREALSAEAELWGEPPAFSHTVHPRFTKHTIAIAVASFALVSVAATWLITRDVTNPTVVVCYREVSLNSDRSDTSIGGDLNVDLCAEVWENGILVNEAIVPAGQVPPFVGCVTDQGVLAVFPSDDRAVCNQLGLAVPNEDSLSEGRELRDLELRLIEHFDAQDCQSIGAAAEDVRKILDDHGYEDWSIRTSPDRPDQPCASLAFDVDAKTIHLVPIPDLG